MLKNTFLIDKSKLQNLSLKELNFLQNMIKKDFLCYPDDMKEFDISRLLEYEIETEIDTDRIHESIVHSRKRQARLSFVDSNQEKAYNLNVTFQYQ